MAKKASTKTASGTSRSPKKSTSAKTRKPATKASRSRRSDEESESGGTAGEAFINLLQSPLVAELLAVGAMAALAALAEHGFSSRDSSGKARAGKAVKEAGKAAASAIGRRLATEVSEIRKAASEASSGAKA